MHVHVMQLLHVVAVPLQRLGTGRIPLQLRCRTAQNVSRSLQNGSARETWKQLTVLQDRDRALDGMAIVLQHRLLL